MATARLRSLLRKSTLFSSWDSKSNSWDSKSPVPQGATERGFNWRSANCGAALSYSSGIRFRSVFANRHSARICYRERHEMSRHTGRLFSTRRGSESSGLSRPRVDCQTQGAFHVVFVLLRQHIPVPPVFSLSVSSGLAWGPEGGSSWSDFGWRLASRFFALCAMSSQPCYSGLVPAVPIAGLVTSVSRPRREGPLPRINMSSSTQS